MFTLRRVVVGLFVVQAITGLLLMTAYSPSTTSAWGSVWYIQTQVPGGWLIRGMHHFASDALILVLLLYAGQLLVAGRYRPPRQVIWRATLVALGLALGLSLSGHLLPWDQAGYWGTKVRTNILARTPVVGEMMAKLLIGGAEFGNLTLTRFYTLHIAILPLALGWLLFRVYNRSTDPNLDGAHLKSPSVVKSDEEFSGRPLRAGLRHMPSAVAFTVVMLIVIAANWYARTVLGGQLLDAPADPTSTDYPARPEWHTLFLYQWLKAFEGPVLEVIGAIAVPSSIGVAFFLFPFAERVFSQRTAHRLVMGLSVAFAFSAIGLTFAAKWDDREPDESAVTAIRELQRSGASLKQADEAILRAEQFNRQRTQAERAAKRAIELAGSEGIPPGGPTALLASDPLTAGPRLFAVHCATCHRYDGHDGLGVIPLEPASSSDLAGFASREWIRGLLADPMDDRYFGRMRTPEGEPAHTRMSKFIAEVIPEGEDARRSLHADFDAVAAFLAQGSPKPSTEEVASSGVHSLVGRGKEVFMNVCNECHSYDGQRMGTTRAPEMLGYGSVEWIEVMIAEPDHDSRYRATGRERARMPRFKDVLTESERKMIAQWLYNSREAIKLSD